MTIPELFAMIEATPPARVAGTAVYLVRSTDVVPHALLQNLLHNKVLHERVVFLAIRTEGSAYAPESQRIHVDLLAPDMYRVTARHGFAEDAEVPTVLEHLKSFGLEIDMEQTTFFLGRETLLATNRPGMAIWRERLYVLLARNARRAATFFRLPPARVCELGTEIEL